MNKSLCAFPWMGAAVRPDGTILPCCKFMHNKNFGNVNDIEDPRKSQSWLELRQKMLNGLEIDNCHSCYTEEKTGVKSLRQESLEYFIPITQEVKRLRQLEVSFDNICNLACVMCSEEFSTKWQSEKIKHRNFVAKGITNHGFDYLSWDLSQVEYLKIIGGEPMLSQEKFIQLLEKFDLKKLHVMVATNATVLPNDTLKDMFEKCKRVSYKVSLDGVGAVNNWIRWPSKFESIETNVKRLNDWWKDSQVVDLQFHTTIGIYNIFSLNEIVEYYKLYPDWGVTWNWITTPTWQAISVIPKKTEIIDMLKKWGLECVLDPNPFYISIERLNEKPRSTWEIAVEETNRLSKERNVKPISVG
jgi:radical SAM protein with 4Fe4S-binding SPASM domain